MEPQKPISHLVAGSIIGAILIIFSCVIYFAGLQSSGINWLQYLIIIGGLIIFINLYGKALNNQVSFGNLFAYGFKTTAFFTLVIIVFTVIFLLMFPNFKEKGFEMARERLENRGNMTEEEIDKAIETIRKMFWVFAIGGILLINAIVGAIGSAIGAAITKKKPINPMDQLGMH